MNDIVSGEIYVVDDYSNTILLIVFYDRSNSLVMQQAERLRDIYPLCDVRWEYYE